LHSLELELHHVRLQLYANDPWDPMMLKDRFSASSGLQDLLSTSQLETRSLSEVTCHECETCRTRLYKPKYMDRNDFCNTIVVAHDMECTKRQRRTAQPWYPVSFQHPITTIDRTESPESHRLQPNGCGVEASDQDTCPICESKMSLAYDQEREEWIFPQCSFFQVDSLGAYVAAHDVCILATGATVICPNENIQ
jgi:hypothetical protein